MNSSHDVIIIGAGIVGLTLARELALRRCCGRILVLEKEARVGEHASGRNSGVVHAGIYYATDSLKAKFCVEGARRLIGYVDANGLPILKCGKVIVATRPENVATLDTLMSRAAANGVVARKLNLTELKEIEPEAKSHEWAIYSPHTAVIDSKAVLDRLVEELGELKVEVRYGEQVRRIDVKERTVHTGTSNTWRYERLVNTAGVNADRIAHQFGVGLNYRILPFKGLYWKSTPAYQQRIRGLIYPAPDIRMPFLGVHITKTVDGKVLFGPTAVPAFGRENYSLARGLDPLETPAIAFHLLTMLIKNPSGFRAYVREELARYIPRNFYLEAKTLVHRLDRAEIAAFYKVGIRPQLMDLNTKTLEMDFVIKEGDRSLHVLNAISPAFTSAMGFAPYLADRMLSAKPAATVSERQTYLS